MTTVQQFTKFEDLIRKVLAKSKSEREIIDSLKPMFQPLLAIENLIPEDFKKPLKNKYGQYLLYKPKDESFSIVAFVWGPGQAAPIHDHLVWGLVGVYEGAIEEKRYRKIDASENDTDFGLQLIETVIAKKDDITFVYPPHADIHSVRNPFSEQAITIHVYGTDIGKQTRHSYDEKNSAITAMITPHANKGSIYRNYVGID